MIPGATRMLSVQATMHAAEIIEQCARASMCEDATDRVARLADAHGHLHLLTAAFTDALAAEKEAAEQAHLIRCSSNVTPLRPAGGQ